MTVVRQDLAAVFLLVSGVITSGCGDTATVNPVVELASLTVSPGTLQPAFTGGTTDYNVNLTSDVTSVRITAQPAVAGDTVTINGQATTSSTIPLKAAGTTTPVSIVVSESDTNSRTYTVLLVRADLNGNNSLESLTVSSGALDSPFSANDLSYKVDVANNVTNVTISATKSDPNAVMLIGSVTVPAGTPSGSAPNIPLGGPGSATPVSIVVTAQNGNPKTYLVTVSRGISSNSNLQNLTVSPGKLSPAFSPAADTDGYTVNLPASLPSNVTSMTVTPTLQDPTASMKVNRQPTTSGQAQATPLPGPGSSTFINIVVTAQNNSQTTYSVNVIRAALGGNNNLQSLTVSPGTLSPAFSPAVTDGYKVNLPANLPSNVTSVTVTPTLQDSTASMKVNGQPATSGQAQATPLPGPGSSTFINIVVTAQNNSQQTYSVNVIRAALGANNNLQSLTVSSGTLTPAFNANTEDYTVDVGSNVGRVTVTPTLSDPTATMTVNGKATNSGHSRTIQLDPPGLNTAITIVVTAPNGNQKIYTATIERATPSSNNNLSGLTLSPGSLAPAFSSNTLPYTVDVATDVTDVTVTATKSDPNAVLSGSIADPGAGQATGQATIHLGGPGTATPVSITVTAPSGDVKTYTLTVNRAAPSSNNNLSALTLSPGTLTPVFDSNITAYTVDVTSDVTSVTVTATLADTSASMTINGQGASSGQASSINLGAEGSSMDIDILVTALNGSPKTYVITVNKAALGGNNNLSALTATPGTLAPVFDSNTTAYTVDVATDVTEVTITATKADPNAVLSGSIADPGVGQATGQATITLNGAGTSTSVSITVTAQNGNSQTYTITVNRPAQRHHQHRQAHKI